MTWALKNIGLTIAGLCFLMGCITIESQIAALESKLDKAIKVEATLRTLTASLPSTALAQR